MIKAKQLATAACAAIIMATLGSVTASAKNLVGTWSSTIYSLQGYPSNAHYYDEVSVIRYKDVTNYALVLDMTHTSTGSNYGKHDITKIVCKSHNNYSIEINDGEMNKLIACDPVDFFENLFLAESTMLRFEVQCTTPRANDIMESTGEFYSGNN